MMSLRMLNVLDDFCPCALRCTAYVLQQSCPSEIAMLGVLYSVRSCEMARIGTKYVCNYASYVLKWWTFVIPYACSLCDLRFTLLLSLSHFSQGQN